MSNKTGWINGISVEVGETWLVKTPDCGNLYGFKIHRITDRWISSYDGKHETPYLFEDIKLIEMIYNKAGDLINSERYSNADSNS